MAKQQNSSEKNESGSQSRSQPDLPGDDSKAPNLDASETTYMARIADWNTRKGEPVLTPDLGQIVLWYKAAVIHEDVAVPAMVTKVERPGVCSLTVFRPQSRPETQTGVMFDHMIPPGQRRSQMVQQRGSWKFRSCDTLEPHYREAWREHCQEQINQNEKSLETYRVQKAERIRQQQELLEQTQGQRQ